MEKQKRFTLGRIFIAFFVLIFFSFIGCVMYSTGDYYKYRDAYSGDIARGDQLAAKKDLENLNYFYDLNFQLRPFNLDWLANEYIFKNLQPYEAAYIYLTGRHEMVIDKLKNDDSYWGHFIRANSKWRLAQGIFENSLKKDEKTKIEEQKKADEMAYSTKDDYEQAIKIDKSKTVPPNLNYDFTTNASARAAALQPKPEKIKVKLGTGGRKNKGLGKDRGSGPEGDGQQDLEIEGPPTDGKPKSGTNRPG